MAPPIIHNFTKEIKGEIRDDTIYHIVLSIAVIVKIIFIISAIICYIYEEKGQQNTKFFKKIVRIKDITNELTIIIVCCLIFFIFNPFNNTFCIDKHFKTLLFVFAIFTLIEVKWVVFTGEVLKESNILQFFFGRIGTLKQQVNHDQTHSEYYKTTNW